MPFVYGLNKDAKTPKMWLYHYFCKMTIFETKVPRKYRNPHKLALRDRAAILDLKGERSSFQGPCRQTTTITRILQSTVRLLIFIIHYINDEVRNQHEKHCGIHVLYGWLHLWQFGLFLLSAMTDRWLFCEKEKRIDCTQYITTN